MVKGSRSLVALAAAQALADDVDAWGMPLLRALLPVAGMTIIEHQATRAHGLGITRMLVLVDAVPAALAEACDRVRGRGLPLELVRCGDDVLTHMGDADQLLLVADGLIAGDAAWRRALAADNSAILVTDDTPMTQGLERIDATTRWAGLALIEREILGALDGAPADWDPQLLLFRHAVQQGVARISCDPSLFVSGDMALAETPVEAVEAEHRLLSAQVSYESGIAARWVIGPVLRLFSGALLRRQDSGVMARLLTPMLAIAAAFGALFGHLWIAALCGVLAAIAHQSAVFIARFRSETRMWRGIGIVGLAFQFIAIALAERGLQAGNMGQILGDNAMMLTFVLLIALALQSRIILAQGRLPDFGLAWVMVAAMTPSLGLVPAFDLAALLLGFWLFIQILAPSPYGAISIRQNDAV